MAFLGPAFLLRSERPSKLSDSTVPIVLVALWTCGSCPRPLADFSSLWQCGQDIALAAVSQDDIMFSFFLNGYTEGASRKALSLPEGTGITDSRQRLKTCVL